ncbi:MAG TPA: hypothetical protein VK943_05550 [Arenibaculum sp.]|nr:hypothetical protein [Arenibaculum sp.]
MSQTQPRARTRARPRRRAKKGGASGTVALVLLLPLVMLFMPTALLMAVGLVPTMVAFIVDRDPDKTAPMTVGAMNFVGVMAFAISLWRTGNTLDGALALLADPFTWLGMYGAAGVGWALYHGIPPAVAMWIAVRAQAKITRIEGRQDELVEEWGPEVSGEAGETEQTRLLASPH